MTTPDPFEVEAKLRRAGVITDDELVIGAARTGTFAKVADPGKGDRYVTVPEELRREVAGMVA